MDADFPPRRRFAAGFVRSRRHPDGSGSAAVQSLVVCAGHIAAGTSGCPARFRMGRMDGGMVLGDRMGIARILVSAGDPPRGAVSAGAGAGAVAGGVEFVCSFPDAAVSGAGRSAGKRFGCGSAIPHSVVAHGC